MKITSKLNERFCKDMNIPIKLFKEPYFSNRLRLYNKQFDTINKYKIYTELINKYENEQSYFEAYNSLKDRVIEYIKGSEGMKNFNEEEMYKFEVTNNGFCSKDIYKETFDSKTLLSIDMSKANFTALKHYDKDIVGGKETYEEFIGLFTDEEYFKSSKYIRQVIFGNQNPKRQTSYEKYLMNEFLNRFLARMNYSNKIVAFSSDEIVLDLTNLSEDSLDMTVDLVEEIAKEFKTEGVILRIELFDLRKIPNTSGYIKKFLNKEGYEFKSIDSILMPFVLRAYEGEEIQEEDLLFYYEGRLAKLIDVPDIQVV